MTAVGITGHRALADPDAVRVALVAVLTSVATPLLGISALAAGADQLFGKAVLAAGGSLEVIVPSTDYRATLPVVDRPVFDELLDAASLTTYLEFEHAGNAAYLAAGLELLNRSDLLVAVWDGQPARGSGGTADMVARAWARRLPVHVITASRAL